MSQVPTSNVNALYSNSTPGTVISPTIFDSAIQDIIATINGNDTYVQSLVTSGTLSPIPPEFMERQAAINPNFEVAQRGTSFTSDGYTLDHWNSLHFADGGTLPTITRSRQTFPGGFLDKSFYYYSLNFNSAGSLLGANSYGILLQPIEFGVRYLCGLGKKVTVSFYARSSIAGKRLGVTMAQSYGSGGSPSPADNLTGTTFTLTSNFQKFTFTFDTTTLSGKTFGTNNDDLLGFYIYYVWGSSRQGFVGATTPETFGGAGNVDFAQVQINAGDAALPFQPRNFGEEMELCRRYCQKRSTNNVSQYDLSPVMRINPTITGSTSPYVYDAEL